MLSNKNHPWRTMGKWTFFPSEIQFHHGTSVVNFTVGADHEMYHAMWPTSIGNLKYFLSQRTPPYFAKWRSIVKIIMLLARDGEQNLSGWWAFVTLKLKKTVNWFLFLLFFRTIYIGNIYSKIWEKIGDYIYPFLNNRKQNLKRILMSLPIII